jgi:hypothetical protein
MAAALPVRDDSPQHPGHALHPELLEGRLTTLPRVSNCVAHNRHPTERAAMPDRNPNWQGYLTLENLDEVHERLSDLLSGWFTVVEQNDGLPASPPRVRTSQRAGQIELTRGEGVLTAIAFATIMVADNSHVWSISTSYPNAEAVADDDDPKRQVHLTFEPGRVAISQYVPAGHHTWWVVAAERHED